jgi:hypothetical protein
MDFNFVEFRYHYQPQGDEESGPQDTTTRIGGDCNATDLSRAFFHFAASMGFQNTETGMKRKPLISIEEQLYRAGIWERPGYKIKEYTFELPQFSHILPAEVKIVPVDESMIAFMNHPLFDKCRKP